MNAFAQKEGLPGMGYIFWREKTADRVAQELGITVKEAQAKLKSGEVTAAWKRQAPWPRTSAQSAPKRSASSLAWPWRCGVLPWRQAKSV